MDVSKTGWLLFMTCAPTRISLNTWRRIIRAFLKEEQRALRKAIEAREASKTATAGKSKDDKKDMAKKATKTAKAEGVKEPKESKDSKLSKKKSAPKS